MTVLKKMTHQAIKNFAVKSLINYCFNYMKGAVAVGIEFSLHIGEWVELAGDWQAKRVADLVP